MGHNRQLHSGNEPEYRRLRPDDNPKIKLRRESGILKGFNDWRIANLIAGELGVSPRAVESRISYLVKKGELPENPNKQEKRRIDRGRLVELRDRLLEEGLCDGAIARAMAKEEGGDRIGSLKTAISAMKREGKLDENPNNQVEVSAEEYAWIKKRAVQLASIGLNKVSIARVLEHESEQRNANAIRRIVWELEKEGWLEIGEKNDLASRQIEYIIIRRAQFIKAGLRDQTIASRIAKDMGRKFHTIKLVIHRIVEKGGCAENPKG